MRSLNAQASAHIVLQMPMAPRRVVGGGRGAWALVGPFENGMWV